MQPVSALSPQGAVAPEDDNETRDRQETPAGGPGENLVTFGAIAGGRQQAVPEYLPPMPKTIEDTGLSLNFLLSLAIKILHVHGIETPSQLQNILKVPQNIANELLEIAKDRTLVEVLGANGPSLVAELRYSLTDKGKKWAAEAQDQSQYVGAAPVPLDVYCAQIEKQAINTERVRRETLAGELSKLILPPGFLDELGPAVNSGRAILLYGVPGTGKTSIAEAVGRSFRDLVYVPHAVEIDNQIIKVFDPTLHQVANEGAGTNGPAAPAGLWRRGEEADPRWVPCKRPVMIAGGELTLDLLDLSFNPHSKFYEAPLQLKAMNGVFIIDDFGRQQMDPKDLLNRWIIPLERRVDYLALHTGKKFKVPFNELIIFSTNLEPEELMDDAFLRRIPYKIEMTLPTVEEYSQIFEMVCAHNKVEIPDGFVARIMAAFYEKHGLPLGNHHPKFIIERIIDKTRFAGEVPRLDLDSVEFALRNLTVHKGLRPRRGKTPNQPH